MGIAGIFKEVTLQQLGDEITILGVVMRLVLVLGWAGELRRTCGSVDKYL